MRQELGRENTVFVHLTLVPWIAAAQELKTKPTQHSVKELLSIGIQADILMCRSDRPLSRDMKQKIAAFCNVEERAVIGATTVPSIYEVPLGFAQEGVDSLILKYLHKEAPEADLSRWKELVDRCYHPKDEVHIAIVGKYVEYEDSYKSLKEALTHGAISQNLKLNVTWIEAEGLESKTPDDRSYESQLEGFDGILVPGGFGKRGIEGMLNAIRYAREKQVPYFGICLGMQTACIEFARNVCGLKDANSSEFDPATQHRVIYKLRELLGVEEMGGTMRLGAWTCILQPDSLAAHAYGGATEISERHRHRYEFNREYEALLTGGGLQISGTTPDSTYVEIVEIPRPSLLSWAASSTPSSSRSRSSRIRCSGSLLGELQEPAMESRARNKRAEPDDRQRTDRNGARNSTPHRGRRPVVREPELFEIVKAATACCHLPRRLQSAREPIL